MTLTKPSIVIQINVACERVFFLYMLPYAETNICVHRNITVPYSVFFHLSSNLCPLDVPFSYPSHTCLISHLYVYILLPVLFASRFLSLLPLLLPVRSTVSNKLLHLHFFIFFILFMIFFSFRPYAYSIVPVYNSFFHVLYLY